MEDVAGDDVGMHAKARPRVHAARHLLGHDVDRQEIRAAAAILGGDVGQQQAGRARLERDFPEVVIHGWKSKGEMREILGDARALVVSSRVPEPFGLAALEAVTSGIPVILPDMALLGDELAMLGCGSVFQSGKVEALAGGLRRLAGDDMLLRLMSVNCLRRSSEMAHTPASWRQALLALYDRVLERANAARTSSQLTARGGISAGHRLIDEAG